MTTLLALLKTDILFTIHWFKKETLSKALISLGFFLIFSGVFFSIFFYTRIFFRNLFSYKEFGFLTANYLLHASIILIFWFSIVSSIFSDITFLATHNKNRDFLLTQPIKSYDFVIWHFIRTTFMNVFFLLMTLFPIGLSYTGVFLGRIDAFSLLRLTFVILSLILISSSFGAFFGLLITSFIKGKEKYAATVGGAFFFLISFIIVQLIFPKSLGLLYESSPLEFLEIYSKLPLVSIPLPTKWFIDTLSLKMGKYSFYLFILTIFSVFFSIYFQSKKIILTLKNLSGGFFAKLQSRQTSSYVNLSSSRFSLVIKDWISLVRTPSEVSYAIFLLSLSIFFFLFLIRATTLREINPKYTNEILVFSLSWLGFFATCYLLRLVFPLMAREGPSFWYIFTQPVEKESLLHNKMILGGLLSIPLLFLGILLWFVTPYASSYIFPLIALSLIMVIVLALVNCLMGAINPNFSQGDDPEKVSTSSIGLVTLFVSAAQVAGLCLLLYLVLTGNLETLSAFGLAVTGSILVILLLYGIAYYFLSHYQF